MTRRRSVGFTGLVAVMVVGLGLAVVTRTRPYTKDTHEAQVASNGARRAAATTTQLERSGWSPIRAANRSGWVGVVPSDLVESDGAGAATPHHSRAPPI